MLLQHRPRPQLQQEMFNKTVHSLKKCSALWGPHLWEHYAVPLEGAHTMPCQGGLNAPPHPTTGQEPLFSRGESSEAPLAFPSLFAAIQRSTPVQQGWKLRGAPRISIVICSNSALHPCSAGEEAQRRPPFPHSILGPESRRGNRKLAGQPVSY